MRDDLVPDGVSGVEPPAGDDVVVLIDDVRAYFETLKHLGLDTVPLPDRPLSPAARPDGRERRVGRGGGRRLESSRRSPARAPQASSAPPDTRYGPASPPDLSSWLEGITGGGSKDAVEAAAQAGPGEPGAVRVEEPVAVARDVAACRRCPRARQRARAVPGAGASRAALMFVGDIPSEADESAGLPFQGAPGRLFDRMLQNVLNIDRSQVYLTHLVKCRGGAGVSVTAQELEACAPFLAREIAQVQPRVVVAVGELAARELLKTEAGLDQLAGKSYRSDISDGFVVRVLDHPRDMVGGDAADVLVRKRRAARELRMIRYKLDHSAGKSAGESSESSMK